MATSFLGLRTCIYRIPNNELAAATEWYSNALGIKPYFNEPFYVGFEVGGYELGLHPLPALPAVALAEEGAFIETFSSEAPSSAKATAGKAGKAENIETYWGVEDIQAAFAQLLAAGAIAHEQPNNVGGDIWVALVKDPWGNMIGIIQNPHFVAK